MSFHDSEWLSYLREISASAPSGERRLDLVAAEDGDGQSWYEENPVPEYVWICFNFSGTVRHSFFFPGRHKVAHNEQEFWLTHTRVNLTDSPKSDVQKPLEKFEPTFKTNDGSCFPKQPTRQIKWETGFSKHGQNHLISLTPANCNKSFECAESSNPLPLFWEVS